MLRRATRRLQSTAKAFKPLDTFERRHIGPSDAEIAEMCKVVGVENMEQLLEHAVPKSILSDKPFTLRPAMAENELVERLRVIASHNTIAKSYIGLGYNDCLTPSGTHKLHTYLNTYISTYDTQTV